MNHIADMKEISSRMVDFVDIVRNLLLGNLSWVPRHVLSRTWISD